MKKLLLAALGVTALSGALYFGQQSLSAQVALPTQQYTPLEAAAGITLKANTHNFFNCVNQSANWPIIQSDTGNNRFWIYEFTGQEPPFNGDFFISPAELNSNPQLGSINELSSFKNNKRYYVMSEFDIKFKCGESLSITPRCGDAVTQSGETCDDGNTQNGDGCNSSCSVESVCGNSKIESDEACDDGDKNNFDGCSEACEVEAGFTCDGEPSNCQPLVPTLPNGGSTSSNGGASSQRPTSSNRSSSLSVPIGCVETDGGLNYYTKGTASINGVSNTDSCSSNTLLEYTCSFGFMEGVQKECEFGCYNGACLRSGDTNGASGGGGTASVTSSQANTSSQGQTSSNKSSSLSVSSQSVILLHSASITVDGILNVRYTKNFGLCARMQQSGWLSNEEYLPDFICEPGREVVAQIRVEKISPFLEVGEKIRVCHPTQTSVCSDYMTVQEEVVDNFSDFLSAKTITSTAVSEVGVQTIGEFSFTAQPSPSDGAAKLDQITFLVSAKNIILRSSQLTLVNLVNQNQDAACSAYYTDGSQYSSAYVSGTIEVRCRNLSGYLGQNAYVYAGNTQKFALRAFVYDTSMNDDEQSSLNSSLKADSVSWSFSSNGKTTNMTSVNTTN